MANQKPPAGLPLELRLTWLQASQGLLTTSHRAIPEMDRQIDRLEALGLIGADPTGKYVIAPPTPKKPPKPNVVARFDEYDEIPFIDKEARRVEGSRTDTLRAGLVSLGVLPPDDRTVALYPHLAPKPTTPPPSSASGTHRTRGHSERPAAPKKRAR